MSKQSHQYPSANIPPVFVSNQHRPTPATQNYPQELLRYPQDPRARPGVHPAAGFHPQLVQIPNVVAGPGQKAAHSQATIPLQPSQFIVDQHLANMHQNVQHHTLPQMQLQYPGNPAAIRQHHGSIHSHGYAYPQQPHPNPHVLQHASVLGAYRNVPHEPQFYYQTQPQSAPISLSRDGAPSTVSNDSKHMAGLANVQQTHVVYTHNKEQPAYQQQTQMQAPLFQMQQPDMYQQNFNSASSNATKTKTKKRSRALAIVDPETQQTIVVDDQTDQSANSEKETSADKSGVCATFAAQVAAVANEPSAPKSVSESEKDNSQAVPHNPIGKVGDEIGSISEEKTQPSNCNPEAVVASFKAEVSKLAYGSGAEPVAEAENKNLVNSEIAQAHVETVGSDITGTVESPPQEVAVPEPVRFENTEVGTDPAEAFTQQQAETPAELPSAIGAAELCEVNQGESATPIVKEVDFVRAIETKPVSTPSPLSTNLVTVQNPMDFSKKPTFARDEDKTSNIEKSTKETPEEVQKYKIDSKKIEPLQKPVAETRNPQKRGRHNKNIPKSNETNKRLPEKEENESSGNLVQAAVSEKVEVKPDVVPQPDVKKEEITEGLAANQFELDKKVIQEIEIAPPINNTIDDATSNISAEEKEVQEKNKQNKEESMNFAKSNLDQVTIPLNKVDNESVAVPAEPTTKLDSEIDNNANTEATSTKIMPPLLKYVYQDGQWSPVNTAGKKVYGREFLMNLQNDPSSKIKPSNLPDLDVVLSNCNPINQIPMDLRGGPKDHAHRDFLLPGFVKSFNTNKMATPSKRGGGGGGGHSDKQSKSNKGPDIIRVSLRSDVKLRETENAWKPRRVAPSSGSEEEKSEMLYKKVRSVLNKLTPQKFETLVNQVRELDIDTEERLQGVIDLVFKKAIDEPNFSVAYALMCKELSNMAVANSAEAGSANFRKLLINRCQSEFEKNTVDENVRAQKLKEIEECADPEKKKELQLTLEEEERLLRVRSVGNIRFIGELFKQNMLTCKIMDQCIRHLLLQHDEENLECLCKLLTTVGKVLEMKKVDLSAYFKKMQNLTTQKGKVSSRIRFMLLDVIDLRANKWVPRRDDSNPKTMDQIQKEVETETLNIEINNSLMNTPRKDDRNSDKRGGGSNARRVGGGGGGGRPMEDSSGWSMPSKTRQVYTVESAKLKNKPPAMDDLQLGSRHTYQWNQPPKPAAVTTPNKFAFLENMPNEPKEQQRPVTNYSSSRSMDSRPRDFSQRSSDYKSSNFDSRNSSRNSNYQSSSRSHSKVREQQVTEKQPEPVQSAPVPTSKPVSQLPSPAELSPEELQKKVNSYFEEYILEEGETVEHAIESFQSTFPVSSHTEFCVELINILMSKNIGYQYKASTILARLLSQKCISSEHFFASLKDLIEFSADIIIDVPMFWEYLAKILVHHAVCHTEFLTELKSLLKPPQESFVVFVAELMSEVTKMHGPKLTTDLWKKSEINWSDFHDNQAKIEQIVTQRNLGFLL